MESQENITNVILTNDEPQRIVPPKEGRPVRQNRGRKIPYSPSIDDHDRKVKVDKSRKIAENMTSAGNDRGKETTLESKGQSKCNNTDKKKSTPGKSRNPIVVPAVVSNPNTLVAEDASTTETLTSIKVSRKNKRNLGIEIPNEFDSAILTELNGNVVKGTAQPQQNNNNVGSDQVSGTQNHIEVEQTLIIESHFENSSDVDNGTVTVTNTKKRKQKQRIEAKIEFEEIREGLIYNEGNLWETSLPPEKMTTDHGILRGHLLASGSTSEFNSPARKKPRVTFSEAPHHVRYYHSPNLFAKRGRRVSARNKVTQDADTARFVPVAVVTEADVNWTPPAVLATTADTHHPIYPLPSLIRKPTSSESSDVIFNFGDPPESSNQDIEFLPFPEQLNVGATNDIHHEYRFENSTPYIILPDQTENNSCLGTEETLGIYMNSEIGADCTKPIYEMLTNCQDPVNKIMHLLSSPIMLVSLQLAFEARGIETVGQLSSLTEVELLRFPILTPRVQLTKSVLQDYHLSMVEVQQLATEERFVNSLMTGSILYQPDIICENISENDITVGIGVTGSQNSLKEISLTSHSGNPGKNLKEVISQIAEDNEYIIDPPSTYQTPEEVDYLKFNTVHEVVEFFERRDNLSLHVLNSILSSDINNKIFTEEILKKSKFIKNINAGEDIGKHILEFYGSYLTEPTKRRIISESQRNLDISSSSHVNAKQPTGLESQNPHTDSPSIHTSILKSQTVQHLYLDNIVENNANGLASLTSNYENSVSHHVFKNLKEEQLQRIAVNCIKSMNSQARARFFGNNLCLKSESTQ